MSRKLRRLSHSALTFATSLYASVRIKSAILFPFLRRFLSKTLNFLSPFMESWLFSSSDDDAGFGLDLSFSNFTPQLSHLDPESLFLVPFRWWSEAKEGLCSSGEVSESEISGTLYNATAILKRSDVFPGESSTETEIVLDMDMDMEREGETEDNEEGVSGKALALVSEWMFLRAMKWHFDMKNVGGFLAPDDTLHDLFSLHIRLLYISKTNSLAIRISLKDNEVGVFDRACSIFCDTPDLFIWDFSGQTIQFVLSNRKLLSNSGQLNEEILLELKVYELPCNNDRKGSRKEEMTSEHCSSSKSSASTDAIMCYSGVNGNFLIGSIKNSDCALGLTGLGNLGNTCFMNSALQCMVHTPKLVDYFLGDFKKDLNFENPLGMKGKLALAFGDLLRKLWAPGATTVYPEMFKSTIASFAPQFSGYNQHDSQEFLAFLLDGLHEDINRVKHKPYIETKEEDDRPDEEVADEHWSNHLSRNDSVIINLCQGQYRSKLVCPVCKKSSVTFDPFMYLSLPLPSTTMRTMTLTVFSSDGTTMPFPVTVTVPKYGRSKDLVETLISKCSLSDEETLLVAEIYGSSIIRFLDDPTDSIELVRDVDTLVAYRLPNDDDGSRLVVFQHQCKEKSIVHGSHKKLGTPLVTRISDFSSGSAIHKQYERLLGPFLVQEEDSPSDYNDAQNSTNHDSEMMDVMPNGDSNLKNEFKDDSLLTGDFQFYLENKILLSMDEPVPVSNSYEPVNILVTWPERMVDVYDTSRLSTLSEVCNSALDGRKPPESVSLYKCLDAFLKEEPLGPEDMWNCPNCKRPRQASKKLDLWRLPEILVIHLKRFSYNRFLKNKLDLYVDFPIDDFDLSSYILHKSDEIDHRYKLYAVSNHYGGMGYGHYTAYVQHGHNRWYEFDDAHVSAIMEDKIKTSAAYVLFYRRV
nr:ubiquitin carboxyl-terminal hydrolase 8-like isoform X1 [Ipomoea trifida]